MREYYKQWALMKTWSLDHAVRLVAEHAALQEEHEELSDFNSALSWHTNRIKSLIEVAVDNKLFPGEIRKTEINRDNWNTLPCDENGFPVAQILYFESTVSPKEFLNWCKKKKIKVPQELLEYKPEEVEENKEDKELEKMVLSTFFAGYILGDQGVELKKDDLYAKVNKKSKISGPKFEYIWKLIPDKYKLGAGNPGKMVGRAIIGGVLAGIKHNELNYKSLRTSLKSLLTSNDIENIDVEYLEFIEATITEWVEKNNPPQSTSNPPENNS